MNALDAENSISDISPIYLTSGLLSKLCEHLRVTENTPVIVPAVLPFMSLSPEIQMNSDKDKMIRDQ